MQYFRHFRCIVPIKVVAAIGLDIVFVPITDINVDASTFNARITEKGEFCLRLLFVLGKKIKWVVAKTVTKCSDMAKLKWKFEFIFPPINHSLFMGKNPWCVHHVKWHSSLSVLRFRFNSKCMAAIELADGFIIIPLGWFVHCACSRNIFFSECFDGTKCVQLACNCHRLDKHHHYCVRFDCSSSQVETRILTNE